ncbi:MAG: metallophosphoesterase family protein [Candidatus Hydrogenedentales bacterium]|jgi:Icc-related predicted phosphoesterase
MKIGRRDFFGQSAVAAAAAAVVPGAKAAETSAHAAPAPTETFSFCVLADPHCAEPAKEGIEALGDGVVKFARCLEQIQRLDPAERPDFVLAAGDIHPWALLERGVDCAMPVYAVAGNHESSRERRQQLRQAFGRGFELNGKESDYYSFVHKGIRFVAACDAGSGGDHIGHWCSEIITPSGQCEWLEQELAQPEPVILFAHIPPERNGADRHMYLSRNDSRWFCEVVEKHRPCAMFFGHLHRATEEYRIGETRCFNLCSCCWNADRSPLGFLHVRVTPDGLQVREIETGRYSS